MNLVASLKIVNEISRKELASCLTREGYVVETSKDDESKIITVNIFENEKETQTPLDGKKYKGDKFKEFKVV